jgi:hypothetical protein
MAIETTAMQRWGSSTMLRALASSWLVCGVCFAANAQTLPLRQNGVDNYAIIAPGAISTSIDLWQKGANNVAVTRQVGPVNSMDVNQRATNSNTAAIDQYGVVNTAIVTQQYNFRYAPNYQSGYSGQQTSYGYLSEFNSGGVSILALTGSSNTLISSFGRNH